LTNIGGIDKMGKIKRRTKEMILFHLCVIAISLMSFGTFALVVYMLAWLSQDNFLEWMKNPTKCKDE